MININGVTYFHTWLNGYQSTRPTLLCLHGFTGSSQTFQSLSENITDYNVLAIDLIGHGQTTCYCHPYRYQMDSLTADIQQVMNQLKIEKFVLLGYSMGARVALSFALSYPNSVSHLILESGSPGLATEAARSQRRRTDGLLAQRLLKEPLSDFVTVWESLPLFNSQQRLSYGQQQQIRKERLSQRGFGLATSLWAMGTGSQANYWPRLSALANCPTLIVVGAEDAKFQDIAQKMTDIQPTMTLKQVHSAGHAVHLEQPKIFAATITTWLKGAHPNETH